MANLKALEKRTRQVKADLGDGDVLTVTYRPSVYTPEFESKVQERMKAEAVDALGYMLAALVVDWDLFEDEAQKRKVALTAERIKTLPMLVISPVLDAVGEDMRPNSRSAVMSGAGSMEAG